MEHAANYDYSNELNHLSIIEMWLLLGLKGAKRGKHN